MEERHHRPLLDAVRGRTPCALELLRIAPELGVELVDLGLCGVRGRTVRPSAPRVTVWCGAAVSAADAQAVAHLESALAFGSLFRGIFNRSSSGTPCADTEDDCAEWAGAGTCSS